jgi:hypothetical protein
MSEEEEQPVTLNLGPVAFALLSDDEPDEEE